MAEQVGTLIKEARVAAGMTQKQLAEAVGDISASDVSKAERGLKELTGEQLRAVAKATGTDPGLFPGESADIAPVLEEPLSDVRDEAPCGEGDDPAATSLVSAADEQEVLALFKSAGVDARKAAVSVLKGEAPQGRNALGNLISKFADAMEGVGKTPQGQSPMALIGSVMNFVVENREDLSEVLKGLSGDEQQDGKTVSSSLLGFTYYYSVSIYILLLSFYFWQWRTDIKPAGADAPVADA